MVRLVRRLSIKENDDPTATDKIRFFQEFISVTDKALGIDPGFIHHQELALLMGRPLPWLELPWVSTPSQSAIHRGWTAFRKDLLRNTRETDQLRS